MSWYRVGILFVLCALVPASMYAQTSITANTTITGAASVIGSISKGSGTFVIDHPLDPKNKLLYHSFVESPDVKNLYDGIALLDEHGVTVVELPEYFLALNEDYRYLVSSIDQAMPDLYIQREIRRSHMMWGSPNFVIAGGTPGGRVSWQVTGIRRDLLMRAHPLRVEVDKGPDEIADVGECLFEPLCK